MKIHGEVSALIHRLRILGHECAELGCVGPGTERPAVAGQDQRVHVGIAIGVLQGFEQARGELGIERIVFLGSVHRQNADLPVIFNQQTGHGSSRVNISFGMAPNGVAVLPTPPPRFHQSRRAPDSSTIFANFSFSERLYAANSLGMLPTGTEPISPMRLAISGSCTISWISAPSLFRISSGVPAGAHTPYQVLISKPGTPDSCTVGTSGSEATRLAVVTARGRSVPLAMNPVLEGSESNIMVTWPPITSVSAGALPL